MVGFYHMHMGSKVIFGVCTCMRFVVSLELEEFFASLDHSTILRIWLRQN